MSKLKGQIAALGAVLITGVTLTACGGGGVPGNAVASVNGTPVTVATFNHWMTVAANASSASTTGTTTAAKAVVPDPPNYTTCIAHLEATAPKPAKGQSKPTAAQLKSQCEQQYQSLKQTTLGFLISANWLLGEANEQGIKMSDAEVQKAFSKIKNQQFPTEAAFQKFLASTGYTVSDLLLRVKLDELSTKIQQKITKNAQKKPSKKEIESYFEQHKSQYGQPEKRNILIILTKTQAQAEKAKKEIESGKSFASVAKAVSIDPVSKAAGGSLPGVVKGQEEKALSEAVFGAKVKVLGGPIKTPFGYYVYEVTKIIPGSQQSLSSVQSTISQQMAAEKQQKALSEFIKNFRKTWTARTECRAEYSVQDCKGYKAPKGSTSTTAP
ncbi:MAG TPA: peptidyl-prolyl cis-trans isomerase [Solirubrobacteraceae bacterium]|nr:peptidyl-prolyl cis-trans isomerase [Solirubrobacteraceae bacterium]